MSCTSLLMVAGGVTLGSYSLYKIYKVLDRTDAASMRTKKIAIFGAFAAFILTTCAKVQFLEETEKLYELSNKVEGKSCRPLSLDGDETSNSEAFLNCYQKIFSGITHKISEFVLKMMTDSHHRKFSAIPA